MEKKTIDELLEILQWAVARDRYRIDCGMPLNGVTVAEDIKAEAEAIAELERRGYYE